jgi:hypothetical protein
MSMTPDDMKLQMEFLIKANMDQLNTIARMSVEHLKTRVDFLENNPDRCTKCGSYVRCL